MNRNILNVTNAVPAGKWIVTYDPARYNARFALQSLVEYSLNNRKIEDKTVTLLTPGTGGTPTVEYFSLDALPPNLPEPVSIRRAGFSYPVLATDKRWDTIHLTASSLFLGSGLKDAGLDVIVKKQRLPVTNVDSQLLSCDVLGFTLFEDLFGGTRDLFAALRDTYGFKGLIAAGGPMTTLSPLKTAYHLPGLNLLVRGEAELVLPGIIKAIHTGDGGQLFSLKGWLYQVPGLLAISDLDTVHRPGNRELQKFRFNLDFLQKEHLSEGLEINLSRGCRRGCVFCSAVQGKQLRKLPEQELDNLLEQFEGKLEQYGINAPNSRTVNINDDDMLQDPGYTQSILNVMKKRGFKLWGVQTSIHSFFTAKNNEKQPDESIIDMVGDTDAYVDGNPLVWCGTDAFLKERGKRLGKWIPGETALFKLAELLEKQDIRHYHYWISSDHAADWDEFTRELALIHRLQSRFPLFGLIAHSPFLVPYATTPVYRLLTASPELKQRIKYKDILKAPLQALEFPLADRVVTGSRHLNRLLDNEKLENRLGFFDYLSQKDWVNTFITVYNFLKQERMEAEAAFNAGADGLRAIEHRVEETIGAII